jgi:hypothetical protein
LVFAALNEAGTSDTSHGGLMKMRRVLIAVGVIALLLVPFAATAKVTRTDKQNAKKECKALRKAAGKTNFARLMHSSKGKAYGLCVKRKSREESRERSQAHKNAVEQCREERDSWNPAAHGNQSFKEFYGTNHNDANYWGKCVSQHARENKEDMDDHDQDVINAAKHCRTEHAGDLLTNPDWVNSLNKVNKRNAFGKCVSWHARHKGEEHTAA